VRAGLLRQINKSPALPGFCACGWEDKIRKYKQMLILIDMSRIFVKLLFLLLAWLSLATQAQTLVDPSQVPESKRNTHQLYLLAKDVPEFLRQNNKSLFLDVRTRAEAMFVGMTPMADALAPYSELQDFMSDWDDKRQTYVLDPNPGFLPEVDKRLMEKGLSKSDFVLVMCRSGERAGRAASRLAANGYAKVISVIDGFEGDMSPSGRRDVNGWKNAGLPWSYKLDRKKVYFTP
jgi:rhodanese-related sulfurtransferase